MDQWYFAYGSNLLREQMIARVGLRKAAAEEARTARLPGHQVVFNMRGRDGNVYANIVEPGAGVIGVLYCCSEEQLAKLDRFERGYLRQKVLVSDDDGEEVPAVTYVSKPENCTTPDRPTDEYLERILTGAAEHGLPEEYLRRIESAAGRRCGS